MLKDKKFLILIGVITVLGIGAIFVTMFLLNQEQDVRSGAQFTETPPGTETSEGTPTPSPSPAPSPTTSCQTPPQVASVLITYPDCVGTTCSFTSANCTWNAVSGAASYTVNVKEVDSGVQVKNESVTTTKVSFPVTAGKTYKCDVTAVNTCGASGAAGTHTLLCEVDGITPTPQPTAPPLPTSPPPPTSAPQPPPPTIPPTGDLTHTIIFAVGGVVLVIIGAVMFLF